MLVRVDLCNLLKLRGETGPGACMNSTTQELSLQRYMCCDVDYAMRYLQHQHSGNCNRCLATAVNFKFPSL